MKKLKSIGDALAILLMVSACGPVEFKTSSQPGPSGDTNPSCNTNVPGSPCYVPATYTDHDESVSIAAKPKVDILFVVDNSGSMLPEQRMLGEKFPTFIESLSNVDWQIAITSTDVSASGDRGWFRTFANFGTKILTSNVAGGNVTTLADSFRSTVQLGADGDGDEQGIYASILAVAPPDQGLIRQQSSPTEQESKLAIVILSDEDERSNGGNVSGYPLVVGQNRPQDLVDRVRTWYGDKKANSMTVHSIVIRPGDTGCYMSQDSGTLSEGGHGSYGHTYAALSSMTDGTVTSICGGVDGSYETGLKNIGQVITETTSSFTMKCTPVSSPLVTFTPAFSTDVTFSGTQVHFTPAVPKSTQIRVQYRCKN